MTDETPSPWLPRPSVPAPDADGNSESPPRTGEPEPDAEGAPQPRTQTTEPADGSDDAGQWLPPARDPTPAVAVADSGSGQWTPQPPASEGPRHSPAGNDLPDRVTDPQRRAVHAYASELLAPGVAEAASADAIGAFSLRIHEAPPADDDGALLAVTRVMVAVSMADTSSPTDRRQAVLASMGGDARCSCREAGVLLADRANGTAQPLQLDALDQHLADCENCRQLSLDMARAEEAFSSQLKPDGGLGFSGGAARVVLGAATVLVIGAAAAIVGLSSGSHHHDAATTHAVSAGLPVSTQPAVPIPTVPAPVVHRAPVVHHVHHHLTRPVTHPTAAHKTAAAPRVASRSAAAEVTPTPAAVRTVVPSAPAASSGTTGAATSSASQSSASETPIVAGTSNSGSLGAVTVPQQGIGTASSGTG